MEVNHKATLMNRIVKIFPTPLELANAFAVDIAEMIRKSYDQPFTIALSGGSTPGLLFKVLSENFKSSVDWKRVHFFWGDERCVAPEDPESNYGMTRKELIDNILIPSVNVHRIKGEDNPDDEARRYSEEILTFTRSVDGIPFFNLVILGLGEDGHTASIFPGQNELLNSQKICEVAIHPVTHQKRITITGKVINNAAEVVFLVAGKKKSEIVQKLFNKTSVTNDYPASGIVPVHGETHWYIDSEAAKLL